ncbi:MAG: Holliday junction branch migration protein RuvA [Deltaproteobacteria bacterium]|nr:Holliday junction branch migration protein RuvA [Deltaproteobacteria bacterium]
MIDRLVGTIVQSEPGRVVLDVHGVGYQVLVPARDDDKLPVGAERVVLHTHVVYAEDRQEAFGFLTTRERAVFRQLIAVAGVGPRTAMAVLSGRTVEELRDAILREDRKAMLKTPGVGGKLAGRLLLELKDKALAWAAEAPGAAPPAGPRADDERAAQALAGMGYRPAHAAHAVEVARAKLGAEAAFEQLLRQALLEAVG